MINERTVLMTFIPETRRAARTISVIIKKGSLGLGLWLWLWRLTPLSTIFHLYRGVSFIGGGNMSTRRKPPTCRKSLTKFIT